VAGSAATSPPKPHGPRQARHERPGTRHGQAGPGPQPRPCQPRFQSAQIGPIARRLAGAAFALATTALGAAVSTEAQLAVLLAGIVAMPAVERRASARAPAAAAP
jgi:hypothetical protein